MGKNKVTSYRLFDDIHNELLNESGLGWNEDHKDELEIKKLLNPEVLHSNENIEQKMLEDVENWDELTEKQKKVFYNVVKKTEGGRK